jgi:hypothetical protein
MKNLVPLHRIGVFLNNVGNLLFVKACFQVLTLNDQLIGAGGTLSSGAATDLDFFWVVICVERLDNEETARVDH